MKKVILFLVLAIALVVPAIPAPPPKSRPNNTAPKPLTYANVLSHFKATKLRTTEVQKRCTVFFEGEWNSANIYNYCLIIVENSDEDIQVTFYATDAHEMNWVTEFFDAPFFARDETEKLFDLMNSDRELRNQKVGRFRVDFHHWRPSACQAL